MKSATFGAAFVGLTILATIGYIIGRIAFLQNPGLADAFSVIWTVVLVALLYLIVRYTWKSTATTTAGERRREVYKLMISVIEVFVFAVLLLLAIGFSNFSATPGNEQVLSVIITTALLGIAMLISTRVIRVVTERRLIAEQSNAR
jgi:hypothetical protein